MKRILSILTISIALFSCGGEGDNQQTGGTGTAGAGKEQSNDLQKECLSGDVVSVRQRVYWALEKFGRMDKGKLQNMSAQDYLKRYDSDGFLIEQIHYDVNDKIVSSRKIEYGEAHRITKEEFYKGETLDEYVVYTYDENNRLDKKEKFNAAGQTKGWTTYIYYPKTGLLQDEDLFKANGERQTKHVHIYDEDGRLTELQKYWGGGSPAQRERFSYADGNLSETLIEKYANKQYSFAGRTAYEGYNSFGYTLKTEYDDNGDVKSHTSYSYDSYGNLKEVVTTTFKKEIITVDIEEQSIEENSDEGDEFVYEEETAEIQPEVVITEQRAGGANTYEYDEQNNWTQKITYKITDAEKVRQFYYDRVITYK